MYPLKKIKTLIIGSAMDYLIKVKSAKYLEDYKIYCSFSNGEEKLVDLKDKLHGEMFEPLKDKNIFMQFKVDDVLKSIVWSNGADVFMK